MNLRNSPVWVIYLFLAIVISGVVNLGINIPLTYKKVLNRFRPDSFALLKNYSQSTVSFKERKFDEVITYFKKIIEFDLGLGEERHAYGLLGYCNAARGENDMAIENYLIAIGAVPNFFWYHYNLSVMYMRENRFVEARETLRRALELNPDDTLQLLRSSKIYYQIGKSFGDDEAVFKNDLNKAITQSQKWLTDSEINVNVNALEEVLY